MEPSRSQWQGEQQPERAKYGGGSTQWQAGGLRPDSQWQLGQRAGGSHLQQQGEQQRPGRIGTREQRSGGSQWQGQQRGNQFQGEGGGGREQFCLLCSTPLRSYQDVQAHLMSREHLDMIVRSPELLLQDVIVAKDSHSQKAGDNSPLNFLSRGEGSQRSTRSYDNDSVPSPRYSVQSGGREQRGYHSQEDSDDGGYQRGSGNSGSPYQGAYQSREGVQGASQARGGGGGYQGTSQSQEGGGGYQGSIRSEVGDGYQRSPSSYQRETPLQEGRQGGFQSRERGQEGSRLQERDGGSYQGALRSQGGGGGGYAGLAQSREGAVGYPVGSRSQGDSGGDYQRSSRSDNTPAQSQRFAVPQVQQLNRGGPSSQDGGSSEHLSRPRDKFGQQGTRGEFSHPLFQQQVFFHRPTLMWACWGSPFLLLSVFPL